MELGGEVPEEGGDVSRVVKENLEGPAEGSFEVCRVALVEACLGQCVCYEACGAAEAYKLAFLLAWHG